MKLRCPTCNEVEFTIQPTQEQYVTCPQCNNNYLFEPENRRLTVVDEVTKILYNEGVKLLRGQGLRYNEDKTPFECVPLHLLEGCAKVFKHVTEREEKPYPMWNWARGMDWSKPYACALRHLEAWYRGEDNDNETNLNHLHHVMCNILMLIHYTDAYPEGDNRPKEYFQPGGIKE